MLIKPSSPGDRIASLRAAPSGAGGRIASYALHTLIAAILARLFARLEQILALWLAGNLPPPKPAPSPKPAPKHRHPERSEGPTLPARSRHAGSRQHAPGPDSATAPRADSTASHAQIAPTRETVARPKPPPHHSRAVFRFFGLLRSALRHAHNITISEQMNRRLAIPPVDTPPAPRHAAAKGQGTRHGQ